MFFDFYILIDSTSHVIYNCDNKTKKTKLSEEDIKLIEDKFKYNNLYYIYDESIYNNNNLYIDTITDKNIDVKKPLKNVYLFVDDENKLLDNILKIYNNISGWIDLKFKNFNKYDTTILADQLEQLNIFLYEAYKLDNLKLINQITGFMCQTDKFDRFGEKAFFIAPNKNIYCHPWFYYANNNEGIIATIENFDEDDEENIHFTKPSLVCQACECFYCDRNIYFNKIETSEFLVPAAEECKKTTFLSYYSKALFNIIMNDNITDIGVDLDIGKNNIDFEDMYERLKNGKIITNKIKNLNINNTKGW